MSRISVGEPPERPTRSLPAATVAAMDEQPPSDEPASTPAAEPAAPMPFDAIYKALFNDPDTVADMLRRYLAEPVGPLPAALAGALDFATLRRLPAEWITRDFRARRGDRLWCADFRDDAVRDGWPARMFLHLEFQSAADRDMALRFLEYGTELVRELRGSGAVAPGEACPILCVAVHNGRWRWGPTTRADGPMNLPAVLGAAPAVPPGLAAFYPWGYHPLDFARHRRDAPVPGSAVSMIIAIENAGHGNLAEVVTGPVRDTAPALSPAQRGVVAAWLGRLAAKYGTELPPLEEIMRLEEVPPVRSLLEETLDRELAEERSAGRTEGREQGRTEGREQGRTEAREEGRELLLAQAALKFGRDAVRGLAEPLRALPTPDTIRQAGLCIVECASAAEMLTRLRELANRTGDPDRG